LQLAQILADHHLNQYGFVSLGLGGTEGNPQEVGWLQITGGGGTAAGGQIAEIPVGALRARCTANERGGADQIGLQTSSQQEQAQRTAEGKRGTVQHDLSKPSSRGAGKHFG